MLQKKEEEGHTSDNIRQRQMLGNDEHFYLSDLLVGPEWPLSSLQGHRHSPLHSCVMRLIYRGGHKMQERVISVQA